MTKNFKKYIIIVFIIAVIYNVLVFAIPFPHKSALSFWITWGFGLLCIISQPFIGYFGFKDAETYKSKVYGWPIIRLGYIYLLVQLLISLVSFVVGAFVGIPFWIILVIEVIIVGFVLIGLIVNDTYKEEITKIENNLPITTKFISDLRVDSETLLKKISNQEIKMQFEKFVEEVRYSDPVSDDFLAEIEDEINKKYLALKDNLLNGISETSINDINDLINILYERNNRVKLSKRK